jgi:hypothetical protein
LPLHNPAQITFKDSKFNEIDFRTSVWPEFATMQVTNCTVLKLHFDNFCNFGAIFFTNLSVPVSGSEGSILCLTNSDLGKLQFINCDLTKFSKFEFSNTKMLEIFVAGSKMPDEGSFVVPDGSNNNTYEQKRLAFGQFKKIYEGQGDVAGSLRYLAFEMDAYLNQLDEVSKKWHENFGERWMLKLNRYSTYYGNDWWLGVKRTLGTIVICYSLFCLSLGFKPGADIARFVEIASYAPQYLNPFRDSDSVIPLDLLPKLDECWNTWLPPISRLIDYLSRIFIAYFVYQTIQAFRKLGKSSG